MEQFSFKSSYMKSVTLFKSTIVGDEVYVIRFLAHEIVDGAVLLGSQLF